MSNLGDILSQPVCLPKKIPSDWNWIDLADISRPKQWKTISANEMTSTGFPVFGANGFVGFYPEYNHEEETIGITCRGNTCGTINRIPAKTYITGNSMALDDVAEDVVSKYFLYYALVFRQVTDSISGSAQPQITREGLSKIQFPAPRLPEQQKIAAILTSVDDVIESTQAQINKLKDLKTGMMQELLTKGIGHTEFKDSPVGRIPKAWEIFKIKDICLSIVDCVNKTAPVVDYPTPYKMIRTTNVRKGRVDTENVRYATQETFEQWTRRTPPQSGDLIFTREAPVGEVGILKKSDGVFLGQRTMLYRANEEKTNNVFLLYSMQSEYCQKQIQDFSGGSTVAHMRVPDCGEILIKVPPIAEQKLISDVLTGIEQSIEIKELKEEKLITEKKALMQDLLTGKVRVKVN